MPRHVVIIGGGFGGLHAAKALARAPVRITLLDRRNHHLFQPLLYQVATAALSPGDIASPIRWILRRQANVQVLLATADGIDAVHKVVRTDIGDIGYDYLVVATGATHAYFGHDDWKKAAPGLKTLADALEIRRRVLLAFELAERSPDRVLQQRLLTFVIVGGGPTGVELAGALAEIAHHALANDFRSIDPDRSRIILVEGGPAILEAFPESLRLKATAALERLRVEVRLGARVTAIQPQSGEAIASAVSRDEKLVSVQIGSEQLLAGTVLWAAGVAASSLGRSIGVPVDRVGRVIVEPTLNVPGHPDLFVIGDLAAFLHRNGKLLPGVAPVAMQEASHAADNIARAIRGEPMTPFEYRDLGNLATIGRAAAVADFGWLRLSGLLAWLAWLFIHIAKLIGFRSRLIVMVQWAWSYFTYQRSVRLITGEDE